MANCPGPALPETAVKALVTAEFGVGGGDDGGQFYSNNISSNGGAIVRDIFVEIARHESTFNPTCVGDEGEIGLFQIHPINFAQFNTNRAALFDPVVNTRVAHQLWKKAGETSGGGLNMAEAFSPWTTIDEALRTVNTDPNSVPGNTHEGGLYPGQLQVEGAVGGVLSTVTDWASGLLAFFKVILDPKFWKRIGIGALGVAVVIGAIIFYNRDKATMIVTKGMVGGKGKGGAASAAEGAT